MAYCLLFTYGMLQPGCRPPKSLRASWPDAVPGELYDLGLYPGAVNVGDSPDWIEGHVLEIDEAQLPEIDEFEAVDKGEYRRKRVTTRGGREVWVYEYLRSICDAYARVERWTGPRL